MPPENVSAVPLSPIVIRLGSLGDMINLSSLLRFLHRRYGMPCVVIGAGPWNEPVYRGNPDVARQVLDAVEAGQIEVLADERSRDIKAKLSRDHELIYPPIQEFWDAAVSGSP